MSEMEVQIILPAVSEDTVSDGLRTLTKAICEFDEHTFAHGLLGGEFGYGTDYENDVFMMHHYCWCEGEDCPWCGGCFCPDNPWRDTLSPYPAGKKCDWCRGVHKWAEKGALSPDDWPHRTAPNFWHKPSGFRIWWYKYIGRDMELYGEADWSAVLADCLDSLTPHN